MKKNQPHPKIKITSNKGILFWITGLSGSGKTTLAKKIHKDVEKKFGKTIVISGDDLRKIFNFNSYTSINRRKYLKMYNKFCKLITDQKINLIFAVVGLFDFIRKNNRSSIQNYVEIFVNADIQKIIKNKKKKKVYSQKKNVVGINIKPEFPKKSHIIINNNFDKSINSLKKTLLKELNRLIFK